MGGGGPEDFQGGPIIFFRKLRRGGRSVFRKDSRGGHLFFRKKIWKLNALSIKLIAILTDKLSLQTHI